MKDSLGFVASLNDLAVIEIAGADAVSFLHGQLTQDVAGLGFDMARLAGYCTAKGRLLGSLVFWHAQPTETPIIYALVKADIAPTLVKRLSMFVLRAKAKLRVTSLSALGVSIQVTAPTTTSSIALNKLSDDAMLNGVSPLALDLTLLPTRPAPWAIVHLTTGTWISAPSADSSIDRWWYIPIDNTADATLSPEPPSLPTVGAPVPVGTLDHTSHHAQWQAADIAAGLPWIVAATQDVFIPQTLNFDLIDGVSFTKGCYPGQEVVARSHYRGTVKRRMAYGVIEQPLTQDTDALPNIDIFDAKNPTNPCGRVINAAHPKETHVLIEVQLSDLASADFRLAQPDGAGIALRSLPYDIKTPA